MTLILLPATILQLRKPQHIFDYTGNKIENLNEKGLSIAGHGIRLMATDDKGNILGTSLALSGDKPVLYRWSNVTAEAKEFISYDKSALGESATSFSWYWHYW